MSIVIQEKNCKIIITWSQFLSQLCVKWLVKTTRPLGSMNFFGELPACCFLYKKGDAKLCLAPTFVSNMEEMTRENLSLQVCKESKPNLSPAEYPHMTCDIHGRPCCMGNEAICEIVSKEECEFYGGRYHDNYTLCSQVSSLLPCRKGGGTGHQFLSRCRVHGMFSTQWRARFWRRVRSI